MEIVYVKWVPIFLTLQWFFTQWCKTSAVKFDDNYTYTQKVTCCKGCQGDAYCVFLSLTRNKMVKLGLSKQLLKLDTKNI